MIQEDIDADSFKIRMKLIEEFPKFIPELNYNSNNQLAINKISFKARLLSNFFYKRIEKNDLIYFKYRSGKIQFMPLFSLTKALACYNDYIKKKDKNDLKSFIKISELMIKKLEKRNSINGWLFKKKIIMAGYPPATNSYSALFNARGLSVLIRYYQFQKSKTLLKQIEEILNSFEIESNKGGVLKKKGKDKWYLEYSYGNNTPVVYNGFLSALIGLYETSQFGPVEIRKKANTLFNDGLKTLENNIENIIMKNSLLTWLRYDDNKQFFADGNYFNIKLKQIKYLYSKTNNIKLLTTINHWENIYKKNKWKANLYEWFYFIYKKLTR